MRLGGCRRHPRARGRGGRLRLCDWQVGPRQADSTRSGRKAGRRRPPAARPWGWELPRAAPRPACKARLTTQSGELGGKGAPRLSQQVTVPVWPVWGNPLASPPGRHTCSHAARSGGALPFCTPVLLTPLTPSVNTPLLSFGSAGSSQATSSRALRNVSWKGPSTG